MDRWLQLILLMPEDDFITSKQLAETLGVSNRTVYNDIVQLNQAMKDKGAQLISKAHYGVKLEVTDKGKYLAFLRSLEVDNVTVGDNTETRVSKIVEKMIQSESPIKMDDLSDELYISRSTLKSDLKKVRVFLDNYNLQIDYRSYSGMSIQGSEKNLRRCLAKIEQNLIAKDGSFLSEDMDAISALLKGIFKNHHYKMSAYSFHNFVTHIHVSVSRIQRGKEISLIYSEQSDADVRNLAEDVVAALERAYSITFSRSEFQYLLLHLECKKIVPDISDAIVNSDVYEITTQMLKEVQAVFHYDFQYDFELVTNLSLHIVPLRMRLLYDMPFENPMTAEICEGAPLAYEMATVACGVLSKIYDKKVSSDEIAYIALHFNVAIDRLKKKQKKNVLIVCGTGKSSSMLLTYRIKEEYGKYLNVVGTHESMNLTDVDFSNIDYILTTVHIKEHIPVPIIEISKNFFMNEERNDLRRHFQDDRRKTLMRYFSKTMFLPHLVLDSKEAVLRQLCETASKNEDIPEDTFTHVMQRESLGSTSFGNYVAIPHPDRPMGKESFVVTGILEHPILWDQDEVQIVFLLFMRAGGDRNLQLFYRSVSRFLSDKTLVCRLIQNQTYEELITILDSLSYELQ
jgi:lichenan operon transcriptional antiterminator